MRVTFFRDGEECATKGECELRRFCDHCDVKPARVYEDGRRDSGRLASVGEARTRVARERSGMSLLMVPAI